MKNRLFFTLMAILGLGLATLIFLGVWVWNIDREWSPLIEPRIVERQNLSSIRVMAKDSSGELKWIGALMGGRLEERLSLHLKDLPPQLVQAIVSIEDPRFLQHGGFDIWGIARAAVKNLLQFRFQQGGSTLTQQLVKNVFLSNKRTLRRKFTELVLATMIENRFSKDEIIEAYMNEIYMGQLGSIEVHGMGRAAEYYFGKKIGDLQLAESALLAALVNGPGVYNPWKSPDKAIARRSRVLAALLKAELILPEEFEAADKAPLPRRPGHMAPTRAAYLMDHLHEKLLEERGEAELLKGGFDVILGLDFELQDLAEKALAQRAVAEDPTLQGLIVAADPRTCEIKAYVGGTSYQVTQLDRIRQSRRAIGSLVKPLEIAGLLEKDALPAENSLNLATAIEDAPLQWNYDKGRGRWNPQNFDSKFRGQVTLRQTLEESLNVPMARVFFDRFPEGILVDALSSLRAYGLEIPAERALPSAVLGAIDQSPWNTLHAYLKLVRQAQGLAPDAGDYECELRFETRAESETPSTEARPETKLDSPYYKAGARLTIAALEGALRRGTSRWLGAKLPPNQSWAGKTGTSSDQRDAWYAALSPDLVVLAWSGRDDNKVTNFTGASGAVPLAAYLVQAWASRKEYAEGWSWAENTTLHWRLVRLRDRCLVDDSSANGIELTAARPSSGTPPPEAFSSGAEQYYWELMRDGAMPAPCGA